MSKSTILEHLNSKDKNEDKIIVLYCFEKGKDLNSIKEFINVLKFVPLYGTANNLYQYCYDYALTYYIQKYNIILLHDKNGKFIKAF